MPRRCGSSGAISATCVPGTPCGATVRLALGRPELPQEGEADVITLVESQYLIARAQGFENWEELSAFAASVPPGKATVAAKAVAIYGPGDPESMPIAAQLRDWDDVIAMHPRAAPARPSCRRTDDGCTSRSHFPPRSPHGARLRRLEGSRRRRHPLPGATAEPAPPEPDGLRHYRPGPRSARAAAGARNDLARRGRRSPMPARAISPRAAISGASISAARRPATARSARSPARPLSPISDPATTSPMPAWRFCTNCRSSGRGRAASRAWRC